MRPRAIRYRFRTRVRCRRCSLYLPMMDARWGQMNAAALSGWLCRQCYYQSGAHDRLLSALASESEEPAET